MVVQNSKILILCKTYPSPSEKYTETSCVAGVDEEGNLIRLFPVPFRHIKNEAQFKKWQWISAKIYRAKDDRRSESHKIYVDTIKLLGKPLPTSKAWQARRDAIAKVRIIDDFLAMEAARDPDGPTLGILRPKRIIGLDITPVENPEWTDTELKKLVQSQQQAGLFEESDAKSFSTLRKLPFAFHYRYECGSDNEVAEYRHKIVDWEVGALFWNCRRLYGKNWEKPFRDKLERQLPAADLMFLMGTIHRFPNQWLIVSLIYPPKTTPSGEIQINLPL